VGWDAADQARMNDLRQWLDSEGVGFVEVLGEQLAQFSTVQPLMSNTRFVDRLHDVLGEWLDGLLDGTFDGAYAAERQAFGQRLVAFDLRFEDVILLEGVSRSKLFEVARQRLGERPEDLSAAMHTLDKALNLDLALICSGYLQGRDAAMERSLLDRFLTVTGFSRTLYENLAETRTLEFVGPMG
jgi:hypothetical protein